MTDIFFPVKKVPVEEIMPGYNHPSGINHAVIITQPDGTERVVQYCSELYTLVPNQDIVAPFEQELSRYYEVEKKVRMSRWARFYIDFILKEKGIQIGTKEDIIFPRVTLINSYDGSVKYNFMVGFFRLICSNGMMIAEGEVKRIKSMHTPKIGAETSFEAVLGMVTDFIGLVDDTAEVYHELQDQDVDDWMNRIEEVIENTKFPQTLHEDVQHRMGLELDAHKGLEPTDWLVYNAFNYQLNHHDDLKAKQSKKDAMDQEVLEYLLRY